MALMDLIGLGADKQAVVIDIGAAFTKVGFAGEFAPRHIIRTILSSVHNGKLSKQKLFESNRSHSEDFNCFRDFFHMLYFKYLLVNPKERRVIICDSILKPIKIRNIVAEVLFKHFEVVSICFIPSHLLALFALGMKSGLVLDCGYEETTVIPIFEQVPILNAMGYIDVGNKHVHTYLTKEIIEKGIVQVGGVDKSAKSVIKDIEENLIEDIKIQCCFVGRRECNLDATLLKYHLDGDRVLNVSGKLRAHAMDRLFEANIDGDSITTMILDTLLDCPVDCRKTLIENIVVIGGSAMMHGFPSRLFAELNYALCSDEYNQKLFMRKIVFKKPPVPENYCVWQGGAIFGALEVLADHSISRERYSVDSAIPDWSSVLSLSKGETTKSFLDEKYKWASIRKTLPTSSTQRISPSLLDRTKKGFGLT